MNLATFIIGLIIFAAVALIIFFQIKNRIEGKSSCSCGGDCGCCRGCGGYSTK